MDDNDSDHDNRISEQIQEHMDIVPYTKRDKLWNYAIYFLVITNAVTLAVIFLIWGMLW